MYGAVRKYFFQVNSFIGVQSKTVSTVVSRKILKQPYTLVLSWGGEGKLGGGGGIQIC